MVESVPKFSFWAASTSTAVNAIRRKKQGSILRVYLDDNKYVKEVRTVRESNERRKVEVEFSSECLLKWRCRLTRLSETDRDLFLMCVALFTLDSLDNRVSWPATALYRAKGPRLSIRCPQIEVNVELSMMWKDRVEREPDFSELLRLMLVMYGPVLPFLMTWVCLHNRTKRPPPKISNNS